MTEFEKTVKEFNDRFGKMIETICIATVNEQNVYVDVPFSGWTHLYSVMSLLKDCLKTDNPHTHIFGYAGSMPPGANVLGKGLYDVLEQQFLPSLEKAAMKGLEGYDHFDDMPNHNQWLVRAYAVMKDELLPAWKNEDTLTNLAAVINQELLDREAAKKRAQEEKERERQEAEKRKQEYAASKLSVFVRAAKGEKVSRQPFVPKVEVSLRRRGMKP